MFMHISSCFQWCLQAHFRGKLALFLPHIKIECATCCNWRETELINCSHYTYTFQYVTDIHRNIQCSLHLLISKMNIRSQAKVKVRLKKMLIAIFEKIITFTI